MQALVHHEQYLKHNSETDGKPVQFYQNWSNMIKFSFKKIGVLLPYLMLIIKLRLVP